MVGGINQIPPAKIIPAAFPMQELLSAHSQCVVKKKLTNSVKIRPPKNYAKMLILVNIYLTYLRMVIFAVCS